MAAQIDLSEKFPEMQPVKSAPSLFTLNGVGLGMAGRRDFDNETQTYLKSLCFVILFIPIFCFRTYRVTDSPGRGWYFIGREPLSMFAKVWNLLFLSSIGALIAIAVWNKHTQSPEYIAARKMDAAHADIQSGNWPNAAITLITHVGFGTNVLPSETW